MVRFREDVEKEIAQVEERLANLIAERDGSPTIPPEPARGSVITFMVQYDGENRVFSYVAHRLANGSWWLSGQGQNRRLIWKDVVNFMRYDIAVGKGDRPLKYSIATSWEAKTWSA